MNPDQPQPQNINPTAEPIVPELNPVPVETTPVVSVPDPAMPAPEPVVPDPMTAGAVADSAPLETQPAFTPEATANQTQAEQIPVVPTAESVPEASVEAPIETPVVSPAPEPVVVVSETEEVDMTAAKPEAPALAETSQELPAQQAPEKASSNKTLVIILSVVVVLLIAISAAFLLLS